MFALVGLVWAAILFQGEKTIGIFKLTNTDNEDLNKTNCWFLLLLALTILKVLSWCVNQQYFLIAYLFPTAAVQLGIALFTFAIITITRVAITYTGIIKKSNEEWFDEAGKEI